MIEEPDVDNEDAERAQQNEADYTSEEEAKVEETEEENEED